MPTASQGRTMRVLMTVVSRSRAALWPSEPPGSATYTACNDGPPFTGSALRWRSNLPAPKAQAELPTHWEQFRFSTRLDPTLLAIRSMQRHLECRQSGHSTGTHHDAGRCTHMTCQLWLPTAAVEDRPPAHAPQVSQAEGNIFRAPYDRDTRRKSRAEWALRALVCKAQVRRT